MFISTDKAVEPETVMGLSKALSERIVETMAREAHDTRLMTVRFGNVLGSSGSVVPLFKRQIAAGGPVTVTDERMTRFFMTIPEAVRLVIQAGAMGNGGEIFVLDMGEPVRIVDLAREMIRLSGLEPDRDIEIVFTGNRGAEKLDEKLFNDGEQVVGTTHPKIAMAVRRPLPRSLLGRSSPASARRSTRTTSTTALRLPARSCASTPRPAKLAPAPCTPKRRRPPRRPRHAGSRRRPRQRRRASPSLAAARRAAAPPPPAAPASRR